MYRPFTKSVTLLLLAATTFTACKKDKDKSRTDLLTEKEWLYVANGRDDNNDGILQEDEKNLEDCEVDDSFKWNADGTVESRDNTIRCGSGDATDIFTWKFQNNETEVVLSSGRLIKIKTLTETTLEITSEELDGSSSNKLISIFKH